MALTLDCIGMACHRPIIELAKAIGGVAIGETITVMADDLAASYDIAAWCRMRGHDLISALDHEFVVVRRT